MTREEFQRLVEDRQYAQLVGQCLHENDMPYVFAPKPVSWDDFRSELATGLAVSPGDIRIVGSGRLGFSMKPTGNLAPFRDTSDIDVVVVNADVFDDLWSSLLRAAYPRPPNTERLGGWLQARRNEVYTGWLTPLAIQLDMSIYGDKAKPVLEIKMRWFDTLKQASRHSPRRHEDVTGRLYRTWQHAELYHLHSLAELRRALFE